MKPTDKIGLPDLPICRDNPFATGVSINQDIVMEEETPKGESYADRVKRMTYEFLFGKCVELVKCEQAGPDRYNADLYANHPTLAEQLNKVMDGFSTLPKEIRDKPVSESGFRSLFHAIQNQRQLLALGREEE